ncbi:hypothetical protein GIY23_17060 [Allosaccharopolyspora coralli]|uniref:MaoC-like domain-containing protein n=1 Tax=Allosaccharopolyspora coralli TaxID=2665642 RepID=A0A5Q3Q954_9PSEU|nr:MaoC/PaaZ C-terminal domain-containing protein [Allosaccharopolyspora coralli]QGK71002.1 hypothetical protein GIY23_17060 [Allosaccharopolyspora coralli]
MTSMHFEDFAVGARYTSGTRTVTDQDLKAFTELSGDRHPLHVDGGSGRFDRPVLHAPFGQAVFFGLFHDLHLVDDTIVSVLDTQWQYRAPVYVGDTLRFEMTITRCRRTSKQDEGVVTRHVTLFNQDDVAVQDGTSAMLLRARTTGPDPVARAFGTVAWGSALAELAADDERFTSAIASWDGTIGLRCGADETQLRIYRGRVIDVSRRSPHGSTFTLGADESEWTELLTGDDNDFMQRAMRGRFQVSGSGYEYLRLTKVLHTLIDHARTLAQQGGSP